MEYGQTVDLEIFLNDFHSSCSQSTFTTRDCYSPSVLLGLCRSSPHMPTKAHKMIFYNLFYNRCSSNLFSNAFIPNHILWSSMSIHPMQHSNSGYIVLILSCWFFPLLLSKISFCYK